MGSVSYYFAILLVGGLLAASAGAPASVELEYKYDRNGNLIQGDGKSYEYNDANRLVRVRHRDASGPVIAEYAYDANGQRVKKVENGISTYYVGKDAEQQVRTQESVLNNYYFVDGQRVLKIDQTGARFFYHVNHLASTEAITDSGAVPMNEEKYFPYGLIRKGGREKYGFTGKEWESLTGRYYYEFRYYDPLLRRFASPDSLIQDVYNPQTLNAYSYVGNAPTKNLDPSGHFFFYSRSLGAPDSARPAFSLNYLVPRYGQFGGPDWTAGNWDFRGDVGYSDPVWKAEPIDQMDALFKAHDIGYRTGNKWGADISLYEGLKGVKISELPEGYSLIEKAAATEYKYAAMAVFGAKATGKQFLAGLPETYAIAQNAARDMADSVRTKVNAATDLLGADVNSVSRSARDFFGGIMPNRR